MVRHIKALLLLGVAVSLIIVFVVHILPKWRAVPIVERA